MCVGILNNIKIQTLNWRLTEDDTSLISPDITPGIVAVDLSNPRRKSAGSFSVGNHGIHTGMVKNGQPRSTGWVSKFQISTLSPVLAEPTVSDAGHDSGFSSSKSSSPSAASVGPWQNKAWRPLRAVPTNVKIPQNGQKAKPFLHGLQNCSYSFPSMVIALNRCCHLSWKKYGKRWSCKRTEERRTWVCCQLRLRPPESMFRPQHWLCKACCSTLFNSLGNTLSIPRSKHHRSFRPWQQSSWASRAWCIYIILCIYILYELRTIFVT